MLIDIVVSNENEAQNKLCKMIELQNNVLNLTLEQNSIDIEDNTDMLVDEDSDNDSKSISDDIIKLDTINKTKKQKLKQKLNKTYITYKIESICGHKIENNTIMFNVKWKNYPSTENSWLTIDKFNEKQMLNEYINNNDLGSL